MGAGRNQSLFKTTSWTQIVGARSGGADLQALLETYWSPVYAFVRGSGRDRHDAADLTQDFLLRLLEDQNLFERADPARGRFRTFLLAALRNFLVDAHRREFGRNGRGAPRRRLVPRDVEALGRAEPRSADDPLLAFDRQWATIVLDVSLRRLEEACRRRNLEREWEVFEARVLRPARNGCQPATIQDIAGQLGADRPQEVYSLIQTMKRRLHRELLDVVAETLDDPAEAEEELFELRSALLR
jgi:RNA polymerase sigma factor (sigma-70 family)